MRARCKSFCTYSDALLMFFPLRPDQSSSGTESPQLFSESDVGGPSGHHVHHFALCQSTTCYTDLEESNIALAKPIVPRSIPISLNNK